MKQLREKPCPQRFLTSEEEPLLTGAEAKDRRRLFNSESQESDGFEDFGSDMVTVEEGIVKFDVLEDGAAVYIDEHVIVLHSFIGGFQKIGIVLDALDCGEMALELGVLV
jgi:hypothetical protein